MVRPGGPETRQAILTAARAHAAAQGLASLTLEAIAQEVGVTKQAVLYHFKSKRGLLVALLLDELEHEAATLSASVDGARSAAGAVTAFVTAAVDYYLSDLARFRILYVANQTTRDRVVAEDDELRAHVYPTTTKMYDALEAAILADPTACHADARKTAVAVHLAALGIASYVAMLDAAGDTLRHDPRALAQHTAQLLARGLTHEA